MNLFVIVINLNAIEEVIMTTLLQEVMICLRKQQLQLLPNTENCTVENVNPLVHPAAATIN